MEQLFFSSAVCMAYQMILQIHLTVYRRQPDPEDHEVQSGAESEEEDDDEEDDEEEEDDSDHKEGEGEDEEHAVHKIDIDYHNKASASQGELNVK